MRFSPSALPPEVVPTMILRCVDSLFRLRVRLRGQDPAVFEYAAVYPEEKKLHVWGNDGVGYVLAFPRIEWIDDQVPVQSFL